jgi:hypothetical protein
MHAIVRTAAIAILAGGAASCGEAPDMPTACANRVADMFDVERERIVLFEVVRKDDGILGLGGAVDAKFWSDGTRVFECRFGKTGLVDVEIMAGDSE